MTTAIGSLWSAEIKPDILSPRHILTIQANLLGEQTKGVLLGELSERKTEDKRVVFTLDMFAPAIKYRHRVLTASHSIGLLYPVLLDAEVFRRPPERGLFGAYPVPPRAITPKSESQADSDDELVKLVEKVLTSSEIVSLAQSLIALSNEAETSSNYIQYLKGLAEPDQRAAIDEKIADTYHEILDSEAFISATAETNASGWGMDEYEILDLNLGEAECSVKLSYSASGEQDMEKPSSGDSITGTAEAAIGSHGAVDYREITAEVANKDSSKK
jgi:hypothetical protein